MPIDAVDLENHAVNFIRQAIAFGDNVVVMCESILQTLAPTRHWIDLKAPIFQAFEIVAIEADDRVTHLTPGIGEQAQLALGGEGRIYLAQTARRGVSRIDEGAHTFGFSFSVQSQKIRPRDVYFAAHLDHFVDVLVRQLGRQVEHGA